MQDRDLVGRQVIIYTAMGLRLAYLRLRLGWHAAALEEELWATWSRQICL